MIVENVNFTGRIFTLFETYITLIIDTDTKLIFSVLLQGIEATSLECC
ncbi:MAG: hypothetical protein M2R46_03072 [Verrucomicrobia subdivision 3 bacterium]|nr:hypothetical protein [Limisphaerales bacterium]